MVEKEIRYINRYRYMLHEQYISIVQISNKSVEINPLKKCDNIFGRQNIRSITMFGYQVTFLDDLFFVYTYGKKMNVLHGGAFSDNTFFYFKSTHQKNYFLNDTFFYGYYQDIM